MAKIAKPAKATVKKAAKKVVKKAVGKSAQCDHPNPV